MVQVYLRVESCLYVSALSPQCTEIHVQQIAVSAYVEDSRWNFVLRVIGIPLIAVAGACYEEQYVFRTYSLLYGSYN